MTMRTCLDRHTPGYFRHRRQQGQPAGSTRYRLVGNAGGTRFHQIVGLRLIDQFFVISEIHLAQVGMVRQPAAPALNGRGRIRGARQVR